MDVSLHPCHRYPHHVPDIRDIPRRRIRLLDQFCWVLVLCSVVTLGLRAASGVAWPIAMLANFMPAQIVLLAACAILVLVLRRWRQASVIGLVAATQLVWLHTGRVPRAASGAPTSLSVMSFNVRATNPDLRACLSLVESEPADVVVLIECSHRLAQAIAGSPAISDAYPHRSLPTKAHQWNGAILSRYPMDLIPLRDELRSAGRRDELQRFRFHFMFQRSHIVHAPAGDVVVSGLWLTSPRTAARWRDGNHELRINGEILERYLKPLGLPILVACDLNAAPGSWRSTRLSRVHGLRRSIPLLAPGSWPADRSPPLRIAIDDVLATANARVVSWRVLDTPAGSDHLPVVVEFQVPSSKSP